MKACFAIGEDRGLDSPVYGHFGSAPAFIKVDTESGRAETIHNSDRIHEHGKCNPAAALGGHEIDAVVVGGIGAGALNKLMGMGITVYKAEGGTVAANLDALCSGKLTKYHPSFVCASHGGRQGDGCSHH